MFLEYDFGGCFGGHFGCCFLTIAKWLVLLSCLSVRLRLCFLIVSSVVLWSVGCTICSVVVFAACTCFVFVEVWFGVRCSFCLSIFLLAVGVWCLLDCSRAVVVVFSELLLWCFQGLLYPRSRILFFVAVAYLNSVAVGLEYCFAPTNWNIAAVGFLIWFVKQKIRQSWVGIVSWFHNLLMLAVLIDLWLLIGILVSLWFEVGLSLDFGCC